MKSHTISLLLAACCGLACSAATMLSQEKEAPGTVQAHLVITEQPVGEGGDVPTLGPNDVKAKRGRTSLPVNQLIPARGENATLQLFVLIDDTLATSVGNNLNDLRDFISAQPTTTTVGIGYMSNATVDVVQDFTADRALAAKAVRLPRARLSTMDSPYLSLISVVKGWPRQNVRRTVLMVTDGIDRLRGESPSRSQLGPSFGPVYHSMPTISNDVDSASEISQRYNVIVNSLYSTGVGRAGRSSWEMQIGLSSLTKLADETGGECFSMGTSNPVSLKPYLERLHKIFDNQYFLVFLMTPGNNAGLQRVNVTTEVPHVEITAADNVWVPAKE